MCGRFTQAHTWAEIIRAFNLLGPAPSNLRARYNVAPTTMVDVIVDRGRGREFVSMRWGLVPGRSKPDPKNPDKPASSFATFNARSEDVEVKATFKDSSRAKRRCIIPRERVLRVDRPEDGPPAALFHAARRKGHWLCRSLGRVEE